jgi:hypothetical protein
MKNMRHLLTLACVAAASPALAQNMDFGGMYSTGTRNYANPYTGGLSCPIGYGAYRILGTPGIDNNLFFCGRIPNGTTAAADFGGMYGYGASSNYPNALTGGFSCPAGFTATQVYGSGIDYAAFFCHRTGSSAPVVKLGGMFGGYWKDGAHNAYPNPITGWTSCPSGYTLGTFLSTINVDYGAHYCYQ